MTCDEVQKFVSAMYDGETVPLTAAEHIAHCDACQQLFKDFAEMGAELRRFGSVESAKQLPANTWVRQKRTITDWWEKGWQMMRVPRIAFASLVLLLLIVGSRLVLVEARAHEDGSVLLVKLALNNGSAFTCPLSSTDQNNQDCRGITEFSGGDLHFHVHFLRKEGDSALVSVRSAVEQPNAALNEKQLDALPETPIRLSSGEKSETSLSGVMEATLTARWSDHVPVLWGTNEELDPSASELRLSSPMLLEDNHVIGDMDGSTSIADTAKEVAYFYIPKYGRFTFSLLPVEGGMLAKVETNRISFTSEGHSFIVVTGAPIARAEAIWVKRDSSYKPPSPTPDAPFLGAGSNI